MEAAAHLGIVLDAGDGRHFPVAEMAGEDQHALAALRTRRTNSSRFSTRTSSRLRSRRQEAEAHELDDEPPQMRVVRLREPRRSRRRGTALPNTRRRFSMMTRRRNGSNAIQQRARERHRGRHRQRQRHRRRAASDRASATRRSPRCARDRASRARSRCRRCAARRSRRARPRNRPARSRPAASSRGNSLTHASFAA